MNAREMLKLYEALRPKLDVETSQELVLALFDRANCSLEADGHPDKRAFYLYTLLRRTFDEELSKDLVEMIFYVKPAIAA